jgi:hypothetical protein
MQQSVQYLLLPHLSPTQTNLMVREHVTSAWKNDVLKSKTQTYIVWPWDLLIVITNTNLIGNWRSLNSFRTSVSIIGIRGNNIISPRNFPFKTMVSITYFIHFLMTNHVPLHNHREFKSRSKITGDRTFSCKLCGSMAGKSNEFKNFWIIYSFSSIANCINRFFDWIESIVIVRSLSLHTCRP